MIHYVYSHHRNSDLAQRHYDALERKHPRSKITVFRFNAEGVPSKRGHSWTFRIELADNRIFTVLAKYKGDKAITRADYVVVAPEGSTNEEIQNMVEKWDEDNRDGVFRQVPWDRIRIIKHDHTTKPRSVRLRSWTKERKS